MTVDIRVIYGDTDQMGIVYYANYLRYFEAARGGFMRARGRHYHEFEALGIQLPVTEAHVRYRKSAKYDDAIRVEAIVDEVRHASVRFTYRVTRGDELLAEGFTTHACVNPDGRPVRMPPALREFLLSVPD